MFEAKESQIVDVVVLVIVVKVCNLPSFTSQILMQAKADTAPSSASFENFSFDCQSTHQSLNANGNLACPRIGAGYRASTFAAFGALLHVGNSVLLIPRQPRLLLHVQSPDRKARVRDANHGAHAPGFGIECRMAEQAAHKKGDLAPLDCQVDQAVLRVAQSTIVKPLITGKEGGATLLVQKGDDPAILHPLPPYVVANLTRRDAPTLE
jgi:hypothetical protein